MGKVTGFMELERSLEHLLPVSVRLRNYKEFVIVPDHEELSEQGARCMDCGIPFCETGCPVNNVIPDWNDLVYRGDWRRALETLHATNNFPEFTGRICPAPCEAACTLNIDDNPVTIKSIERAIIDHGWAEGWVAPMPAAEKTGRKVAVIGSGPAGLACAQQLARAGHAVVVYERNELPGGLLRFGIPDFKMEKHLIDRRVEQMEAEGVEFHTSVEIGGDVGFDELKQQYDAVVLAIGCEHPRDLPVPGRDLEGIHYAMDFLPQQNRRVSNLPVDGDEHIAKGKHVLVIGGGDTGSDCIGTSNRQCAASITQLEIMPQPPKREAKDMTWPNWPLKMRSSSSHEEGCDRDWAVVTKEFVGEDGSVKKAKLARVEWDSGSNGRMQMKEVPGSEFEVPAEMVLLAMGYVHPQKEGALEQSGAEIDGRGNVKADDRNYVTSTQGVYAAGDCRRGQSLVVWAIREGRQCARSVDLDLMGESILP